MNRNRPNRRTTKTPATNDPYHKTGWERAEELEQEIKRQVRRIEELKADNKHLRDIKGVHAERPKKRCRLDGKSGRDLAAHGGGAISAGFLVIGTYTMLDEAGWPLMREHAWRGEFVNTCMMGVYNWFLALVYKAMRKFD